MKSKRILSVLLAVVMVMSLLPMSAMAAGGTAQTEKITLSVNETAAKTQRGPDEDLSTNPVDVNGVFSYEIKSERKTQAAGTRTVLGQKADSVSSGQYAIVSNGWALAVENGGLTAVAVREGQELPANAIWNIKSSRNGYTIEQDGMYLEQVGSRKKGYYLELHKTSSEYKWKLDESGFYQSGWFDNYYFDYADGWKVGTSAQNAAAPYTVKSEKIPGESYWEHTITFKGLQNGQAEVAIGDVTYQVSVTEKFSPEISWERTKEYPYTQRKKGDLVTDLTYLETEDIQKIRWDWDEVRNLTTDPSMTVWDYNTNKQYSETHKTDGVVAATWNNRGESGDIMGDGAKASVRRFTGTFTWPEGYTMDDLAVLTSVNDRNYQPIYDYISQDSQLKERFGGAKVVPINDDMFVYIRKADENPGTWTKDQAEAHRLFWTGTEGKGQWSYSTEGWGQDWDRKEPATLNKVPAVPAYHGVWPNMVDATGNKNEVKSFNDRDKEQLKLYQSDNWYTLVNPNIIMSRLKALYPQGIQDGQQMCIEIYALDNNNYGGMDKMSLEFSKAPVTTAPVTVKYWLVTDDGEQLLGDPSVINAQEIGKQITLPGGFGLNELNYRKTMAENAAGGRVNNGVQANAPLTVQRDASKNIINVYYTPVGADQAEYYTYDFGTTNRYEYAVEGSKITDVSLSKEVPGLSVAAVNGKAQITYKPQDALGTPVRATLVLSYSDASNVKVPIRIIPASNVLYEEDFLKPIPDETRVQWTLKKNSVGAVSDNSNTVYGYSAEYQKNQGMNGAYTASVGENGATQKLETVISGGAFDLIGTSAPNTGILYLKLKAVDPNVKSKLIVIDTSHSSKPLYQVPLAHVELEDAEYNVTLHGAYRPAPASAETTGTLSTFSVGGAAVNEDVIATVNQIMEEDNIDIEDVEFINVEQSLAGVSTFAAESGTPNVSQQAGTEFDVDGFRVYRSTGNPNYPDSEQGLTYTNVMADGIVGDLAAYIDGTGDGQYAVADYEKLGGPENEIYLAPGQGVAFALENSDVTSAQISARAVEETTAMNKQTINHNTELYYEVDVNDGLLVVANTGKSLLALGNIKAKGGITSMSPEEQTRAVQTMALMFAQPEPEPEQPAVPQLFHVNFVLADGAVWKDGTNGVDTVDLTVEDGAVMAPAVRLPEGKKLAGWKADKYEIVLADREALTAQYLQENFTWAEEEPTITFTLVLEDVAPEKPQAFEPAVFDVQVSATNRLKGKKQVNLDVTTSFDVAKLTVNGREVKPNNMFWVNLGLADEYTYQVTKNMDRSETATFNVVAYNAEGLASEIVTLTK